MIIQMTLLMTAILGVAIPGACAAKLLSLPLNASARAPASRVIAGAPTTPTTPLQPLAQSALESLSIQRDDASTWQFKDPWYGAARLWDGVRPIEKLGSGTYGTVFVHPTRPHAVLKIGRKGFSNLESGDPANDESTMDRDDSELWHLAEIGVSPHPLARSTVSGRAASARERIYGWTLEELGRRGDFSSRQYAMVAHMLHEIAGQGFVVNDFNLSNVMIGRSATQPTPRAWLLDPYRVYDAANWTVRQRYEQMMADPLKLDSLFIFDLTETFREALERLLKNPRRRG